MKQLKFSAPEIDVCTIPQNTHKSCHAMFVSLDNDKIKRMIREQTIIEVFINCCFFFFVCLAVAWAWPLLKGRQLPLEGSPMWFVY